MGCWVRLPKHEDDARLLPKDPPWAAVVFPDIDARRPEALPVLARDLRVGLGVKDLEQALFRFEPQPPGRGGPSG